MYLNTGNYINGKCLRNYLKQLLDNMFCYASGQCQNKPVHKREEGLRYAQGWYKKSVEISAFGAPRVKSGNFSTVK